MTLDSWAQIRRDIDAMEAAGFQPTSFGHAYEREFVAEYSIAVKPGPNTPRGPVPRPVTHRLADIDAELRKRGHDGWSAQPNADDRRFTLVVPSTTREDFAHFVPVAFDLWDDEGARALALDGIKARCLEADGQSTG